jgi:hypothetical protein
LVVWAVCFGINYFFFIEGHPHRAGMKVYWNFAFMPSPSDPEFLSWLGLRVKWIFHDMVPVRENIPLAVICLLYLSGIGFMLYRKNFLLAYLCLAPVVIHLILSNLQLYPYDIRLVLYQLPLFIIAFAYLIDQLAMIISFNKIFRTMLSIIVFFFLFSFNVFKKFPLVKEEIKRSLQVVEKEASPGDSLFVYYGAWAAFTYYQQQKD